ncbi:hypothetical protein ACVNP1_02550 [Staphylococcus aureus]
MLIATLLFLSGGQAQAAEKQVNGKFTGGYSYSTIYWGSTN